MPSFGDLLFILFTFLILEVIPKYIFSDGSTGWHLACGDYILQHGSIPRHDFMSYTMPNKEWIPYEWLSDLIMAITVKIGGLNLLAVFITTIIASLFFILYNQIRQAGCNFLLSIIFVVTGGLASSIHWLARPHIFSYIYILILLTILENFYKKQISLNKFLILSFLTMLVYTNSHPSFLLGIGLILVYLCSCLLLLILSKPNNRTEYIKLAKGYFFCLLTCLISTLINPYGYKLYTYIFRYLKGSKILEATQEYESPIFHGQMATTSVEILLFFLLIGFGLTRKKITLPKFIVLIIFTHLMLTSVRFIPLFVVAVIPILGILYSDFTFGLNENTLNSLYLILRNYFLRLSTSLSDTEKNCNMHLLPILTAVVFSIIAVFNISDSGKPILQCSFNDKTMPTLTLDYIVKNKLPANQGFTFDNWGGYIYYKTHLKLFIDDRADFYGQKHYFQYAYISLIAKSWNKDLDRLKINWVLFPKNSKLADFLKESPNWSIACEDKASYLFVRK